MGGFYEKSNSFRVDIIGISLQAAKMCYKRVVFQVIMGERNMFDRAKLDIKVGDFYTKTNGIDSLWKVERILDFGDIPLHVRLVEQGGNNRTATISYNTLVDTKFWKPAGHIGEDKAGEDSAEADASVIADKD